MSVSYWNKVQVLNKSDLNQVAAQHLRALGEDPDPGSLHSFQLAQHLLENRHRFCPAFHVPALGRVIGPWNRSGLPRSSYPAR